MTLTLLPKPEPLSLTAAREVLASPDGKNTGLLILASEVVRLLDEDAR